MLVVFSPDRFVYFVSMFGCIHQVWNQATGSRCAFALAYLFSCAIFSPDLEQTRFKTNVNESNFYALVWYVLRSKQSLFTNVLLIMFPLAAIYLAFKNLRLKVGEEFVPVCLILLFLPLGLVVGTVLEKPNVWSLMWQTDPGLIFGWNPFHDVDFEVYWRFRQNA